MNQIPRKQIRISPALRSHAGRSLPDEIALEPGVIFSLDNDDTSAAPAEVPSNSQDVIPVIARAASANPRRISPLVSGKKARSYASTQLAPPRPVAAAPARLLPPPPPANKSDGTEIIVQLGRIGDILNILPICHESFRLTGRRQRLMVAKEFASVLAGCSYVEPVIFDGHYGELDKALGQAKRLSKGVLTSQVFATGKEYPRKFENYQRDAWARLGRSHRFEQLSLIFDRRSAERESALAVKHLNVDGLPRPTILVSLDTISVPFPHKDRVLAALRTDFPEHDIVDLANVRADYFYDLLGLYDRALCLVAADTATQHLAQASSVPVIAFRCTDPWRASVRRPNHVLNRRYSDIDTGEIKEAILSLNTPVAKIVHVTPGEYFSEEEGVRAQVAGQSWQEEFSSDPELYQAGATGGEFRKFVEEGGRDTHYVLDILEAAVNDTKSNDDIIVFSNSDIGVVAGTETKLRRLLAAKGAVFGYRFNHERVSVINETVKNQNGYWDGGVDLFAFTRRWILTHGHKLPDMLIGRTDWDLVFRDVIKKTGGGELYGCIWHQKHESWWKQNKNSAGNLYNAELNKKYRSENDVTRPYDR